MLQGTIGGNKNGVLPTQHTCIYVKASFATQPVSKLAGPLRNRLALFTTAIHNPTQFKAS